MVSLVCFHFGVMRFYWSALGWSLFFGVCVDLAFGRSFPAHLILLPLVVVLARIWRGYLLTHLSLLQIVPGFLVGFLESGFLGILLLRGLVDVSGSDCLLLLLSSLKVGLIGSCVMIVLCMLLDWMSYMLGLTRYSRVGGEYLAHSRSDNVLEVSDVGD